VLQQFDQFFLQQLSQHPHLLAIFVVATGIFWLVKICDKILGKLVTCARKIRRIRDELTTPRSPNRAA
jgi:hypothetical protein